MKKRYVIKLAEQLLLLSNAIWLDVSGFDLFCCALSTSGLSAARVVCQNTVKMEATKPKRSSWSVGEETAFIESVVDREARLFGKMVGDGSVKLKHVKQQAWEEVAAVPCDPDLKV